MADASTDPAPDSVGRPRSAADLLLDITQDGVWDWTLDTGRVQFSDRWCAMLGYEPHEVPPEVASWERSVHPDDWPAIRASLEPHLRGETPLYHCEHRVHHKDGSWRWILDRGMVVERAADGRALRMVGSHVDLTWRMEVEAAARRMADLSRLQLAILERIVAGADVESVLAEIVALVESQAPTQRVAVMVPMSDGTRLRYRIAPSLPEGYLVAMPTIPVADNAGSCGTAARTRSRVSVDDIAQDARWAVPRAVALSHGLHACTSLPLIAGDGDLIGLLSCYRNDVGAIDPALEPVLDLASHLTTIVLERERDEHRRRQREADLQFLAELTVELQNTLSFREQGALAMRRLSEYFAVPVANWTTVDTVAHTFTVRQEWRDGHLTEADTVRPLGNFPPFTEPEQLHVYEDTAHGDPIVRASFEAIGLRAVLTCGVFRGNAWIGVIGLGDVQPRPWTDRERQLLRMAADRIWSVLDRGRALDEAERERRRLRAVLEALPLGVVVTDVNGEFVSVNDRVEEIWGGAPHADHVEEYGQYRGWWAHSGQPVAPTEWALAQALTSGRVSTGELIRIAKFDGGEAMMLNAAAPIRDEAGAITGAVVVIEDVTEQVRLADANVQLAESTRRKSAFVSYLSHELRTPLNAIMGFTELLHDDVLGPISDLQRDVIVDMLYSERHLLRLLDDVLDTARIEAGKLRLRKERIDVSSFVDDVLGAMRGATTAGHITLSATTDPEVEALPFEADPARLRQVLFNYLSNAIKFTGRGGNVQLHVSRHTDDQLRFSVTDTGIGIALEHQPRLFSDFEQVDGDRIHGGWGLGLALARRLVEAHGGSVGMTSTPGVGSQFWADYPLMRV